MIKKEYLPYILASASLLLTLSMFVYSYAQAQSNWALKTPLTISLVKQPTSLTPMPPINWELDPLNNTITDVAVVIKNTGLDAVNCTLYVYLYNATDKVIAQGTKSQVIASNAQVTMTFPLTWLPNMTIAHMSEGRLTVMESEP